MLVVLFIIVMRRVESLGRSIAGDALSSSDSPGIIPQVRAVPDKSDQEKTEYEEIAYLRGMCISFTMYPTKPMIKTARERVSTCGCKSHGGLRHVASKPGLRVQLQRLCDTGS